MAEVQQVQVQLERKPNMWKRAILIGGGLIVLGIGGCSAIAGVVAVGTANEMGDPNGDKAQPVHAIGETAKVSGAKWTVKDASVSNKLVDPSGYEQTKRGQFVTVDFAFTNTGQDAVTLDTMHGSVVDSKGRVSDVNPDVFLYVPDHKEVFLENVNPGVTKKGTVIFTVAPDAKDFEFSGADMDPISDASNNARFDLGF